MKTRLPPSSRTVFSRHGKAAGFTLIEMMIAITIGLGILAGLVGVLASNASNSRANDRTSELMTNGRYALNSMKQELRQAGFLGYNFAAPTLLVPGALGLTAGTECLQAGELAESFVLNVRQGIWGADNDNPFQSNCIPAASYAAGNDVLVVRRLGEIPPPGAPVANTVYFRSSYSAGQVFRGAVVPAIGKAPLKNYEVKIYVYYISPFTTSAAESPLVPALYRVALQANGSMAPELVASGIEHLHLQYGRVMAAGTQYQDADALSGSSSATLKTDWEDVNSVRIWLLARNTTAEPGYANSNTYAMGSQSYTVADGFRRQLFSTVVQLRN
jgi:type IV pilus assembly protein PilW